MREEQAPPLRIECGVLLEIRRGRSFAEGLSSGAPGNRDQHREKREGKLLKSLRRSRKSVKQRLVKPEGKIEKTPKFKKISKNY